MGIHCGRVDDENLKSHSEQQHPSHSDRVGSGLRAANSLISVPKGRLHMVLRIRILNFQGPCCFPGSGKHCSAQLGITWWVCGARRKAMTLHAGMQGDREHGFNSVPCGPQCMRTLRVAV